METSLLKQCRSEGKRVLLKYLREVEGELKTWVVYHLCRLNKRRLRLLAYGEGTIDARSERLQSTNVIAASHEVRRST